MVLPCKAYTLRGCAAGQGIWFITSLSQRVYDFVRVCQQGISGKIDLIYWMNFVCSPSTQKYNVPQDCVHFVLCPKQANKIEGVVVNRVCILGSFFLNMGSVKPSAAHLYPNIGRLPTHGFVVLVTTVIAPILP